MLPQTSKIVKPKRGIPTEFEEQVAKTLLDLEMNSELKAALRELHIVGAKEVEIADKKAILIYVPIAQLKAYQKIQIRLVRELEKKFGGRTVLFMARRVILPAPSRSNTKKHAPLKRKRPASRTLTTVHNAILEDICFPAEIIGKRIRVRLNGKRVHKVHLDKAQQTNVESKIDVIAAVYKRLTRKDVKFEFREPLV